jgi:hypothetical protein
VREPRSGFSCSSVSLAKPCPRLTLVITIIWVGEWVSSKKPPSVLFPPLASPRVISLQQRARVLFRDRGLPESSRGGAHRLNVGVGMAIPTERRAPPSASYWKEPSQSQCAGAYTAAVALVAQSRGAGRIKFFRRAWPGIEVP